MFQWLLRLLGLSSLASTADPASTDPASAGPPPTAADPESGSCAPHIVLGEASGVVEAPWLRLRPVRSLEPTVLRRHALEAVESLETEARTDADRAFLKSLRRQVEADQLDLPPFPDVARELDELLKETTTDILQIARVVERDPGLVRRVWSQARCALYASPPRSLHHAVARVGLDALWRIGMSVCLNDTVLRVEGFQHEAGRLRVRGIVTAEVAAQLGNEKRGNLYMAGLLHDVGRLLTLRAAGETRGAGPPRPEMLLRAQDDVGAFLSVLVAESWGLDAEVAVGVGYSADPEQAPERSARLARTIRAATIAAHATELAQAGADLGPVNPSDEIASLGFDPMRALDRAGEVMEQLMRTDQPQAAEA